LVGVTAVRGCKLVGVTAVRGCKLVGVTAVRGFKLVGVKEIRDGKFSEGFRRNHEIYIYDGFSVKDIDLPSLVFTWSSLHLTLKRTVRWSLSVTALVAARIKSHESEHTCKIDMWLQTRACVCVCVYLRSTKHSQPLPPCTTHT